jgi:hypothetical protein
VFVLFSTSGSFGGFTARIAVRPGNSRFRYLLRKVSRTSAYEACDTCRHCIRTVDLTKDGNAVPVVVIDLAAIPLGALGLKNTATNGSTQIC